MTTNFINSISRDFFDCCDGIFLNYTWKDDNLKASCELAQEINRVHDVYVGVDVFGRGCLGGFDSARVSWIKYFFTIWLTNSVFLSYFKNLIVGLILYLNRSWDLELHAIIGICLDMIILNQHTLAYSYIFATWLNFRKTSLHYNFSWEKNYGDVKKPDLFLISKYPYNLWKLNTIVQSILNV